MSYGYSGAVLNFIIHYFFIKVFTVPLEERKFKELNQRQFGDGSDQMKICKEIMNRTSK